MRRLRLLLALSISLAIAGPLRADDSSSSLQISADPASIRLSGPDASYSILVEQKLAYGRAADLTRQAEFRSLTPTIIEVSSFGVVRSLADGAGTIEVTAAGQKQSVAVTVEGSGQPRHFNFENDIVPLLSKFGCNSSGCHGKAEGQNGFKLSVFGFDPAADYAALTMEGRGRRMFPAVPEKSLFLQKAAGIVPHGGGLRIARDSREYAILRNWIAGGLPPGDATRSARRGARSAAQRTATGHGRPSTVARHRDFQRWKANGCHAHGPLSIQQRRPGRRRRQGLCHRRHVAGSGGRHGQLHGRACPCSRL